MALPDLSKNPKIDDLVTVLETLDERVSALEAHVVRNDARITTFEDRQAADAESLAEHQVGAAERQAEINELRWAMGHGRKVPRKR